MNANDFMLLGIPDPNEAGKLQLRLSRQAETVIVSHIQPAFAEYIILK